MLDTLLYTLYLWVIFLLFSLIFFPIARTFFGKNVEAGFIASKVLGLLVVSYTAYIIGIFHLVKFSTFELWVLLAIWLFVIQGVSLRGVLTTKQSQRLPHLLSSFAKTVPFKKIAFLELIFFLLFFFMATVRGFQPQIMGLEKYMDFGFIQSILQSDYFPPPDMWWAGETLNYYYFGHLFSGVLIKLTAIPPSVGYNLILALIFALCGSLIITFLWSWTQKLWAGLLGAFMHLGIGNLHLVTNYFEKGGNFSLNSFTNYWQGYWYPDSSRLIHHVITEFPVYSFVVYDLHAHVLAFPQDLLIIGLVAEFFRSKKFYLKEGLLVGFLLGLNFLTNAWDLAVYYALLGLTLLLLVSVHARKLPEILNLGVGLMTAIGTSFLVIVPFWLHFDSLSLPVLPTDYHSPLWQLFQLWGFWFFLFISFAVYLWLRKSQELRESFDWFVLVLMGTGVLWIVIPEFVYVKDIYGGDYQRANTVFKLTFQSWNLFALGGAYIVWRLVSLKTIGVKNLLQGGWVLVFLGLLISCALYTPRAYKSGYHDFQKYSGLDGEAFLSTTYSEADYEAIKWIRTQTPKGAVVVEAAGDSYTEYGRVSSFTGRPTVVGWGVHEWLWRGSFDPVKERQIDVQAIYSTSSESEFRELVRKYNVSYIYYSSLEKVKYPVLAEGLLRNSKLVFDKEGVQIYQVN